MNDTADLFYPEPRFLQAGDRALTVEIANAIDPEVSDRVAAIDRAIAAAGIEGVVETIPTYRSLLVVYDPARIRARALVDRLGEVIPRAASAPAGRRRWHFPVCYGGDHGVDLDFVAGAHEITPEEVVTLHSGAEYRVYMIGFAPGFSYLGGLPEGLRTPRRENPRTLTPANSISIGGVQAAIFSIPMPSGWHLLGRTPARPFDPRREQPFLLKTGDHVRFRPIDADEFARLEALAEAGEIVAESEPVP
jgi:KipI family sensor histidine kinase inhibitor